MMACCCYCSVKLSRRAKKKKRKEKETGENGRESIAIDRNLNFEKSIQQLWMDSVPWNSIEEDAGGPAPGRPGPWPHDVGRSWRIASCGWCSSIHSSDGRISCVRDVRFQQQERLVRGSGGPAGPTVWIFQNPEFWIGIFLCWPFKNEI